MDLRIRVNHHDRATKIEKLESELLNIVTSDHGGEKKMKME